MRLNFKTFIRADQLQRFHSHQNNTNGKAEKNISKDHWADRATGASVSSGLLICFFTLYMYVLEGIQWEAAWSCALKNNLFLQEQLWAASHRLTQRKKKHIKDHWRQRLQWLRQGWGRGKIYFFFLKVQLKPASPPYALQNYTYAERQNISQDHWRPASHPLLPRSEHLKPLSPVIFKPNHPNHNHTTHPPTGPLRI